MPDETRKIDLNSMLHRAGIAPATAEAVQVIDTMLQHWRRRAMKRELGQKALIELKIDLELVQLDVLAAIAGPYWDEAGNAGETMIATVAERLAIDPSRASRLVTDMVELGYARRAVSQADARRTIIELTESGASVLKAVTAYKFLIMGNFLNDWTQDDLATFVPLLKRFSQWMDGIDATSSKHADEIASLAKGIARYKSSDSGGHG